MSVQLIALVSEFGLSQKRNDAFCKRVMGTLE